MNCCFTNNITYLAGMQGDQDIHMTHMSKTLDANSRIVPSIWDHLLAQQAGRKRSPSVNKRILESTNSNSNSTNN